MGGNKPSSIDENNEAAHISNSRQNRANTDKYISKKWRWDLMETIILIQHINRY